MSDNNLEQRISKLEKFVEDLNPLIVSSTALMNDAGHAFLDIHSWFDQLEENNLKTLELLALNPSFYDEDQQRKVRSQIENVRIIIDQRAAARAALKSKLPPPNPPGDSPPT